MTAAFDWDGTIIEDGARGHEEDPARWEPGPAYYVAMHHARQHGITIITGRSDHWAPIIEAWIRERWNLEKSNVTVKTGGAEWRGWRHAIDMKAKHMQELGVTWYTGDQDHLDGEAARRVGALFLHTKELDPYFDISDSP